tara:strand:- start:110 stop:793 length:684 start_codon:yes stop_codon:yes gene_type:complete
MKSGQIEYILFPLLIVVIGLSRINSNYYLPENFVLFGESPLELTQQIVLASCLITHINCRKFYFKKSMQLIFSIRLLFFLTIFYEELSVLTKNKSLIFNSINKQNEINWHNLDFLMRPIIDIKIYGYESSLTWITLLATFFLIIIGFGSYLNFFRKYKFLFIEKKYSYYSLVFIFNIVLSSFLRRFVYYDPNYMVIGPELCEFFIYCIFLVDTLEKRKILRNKRSYS